MKCTRVADLAFGIGKSQGRNRVISAVTLSEIRLTEHQVLTLHFEVPEDDALNGLPKLRAILADLPCLSTEASYADNNVTVTVTFTDEDATDSLLDQIVNAIGNIFPASDDSPPIEFHDARFGRLVYCHEYSWFEGSFEMPGICDPIDIFVDSTPDTPDPASIDRAKQIADEWLDRRSIVLARISESLLSLYNDEWRRLDEDDQGPLDEGGFCNRVSLCSMAIDTEQTVTLRFHADGMFTGHGITATISAKDEIDAWIE